MKILLCKIDKKLGYQVDIEESQESELGELRIRHDVLWYVKQPYRISKLLTIMLSRDDLISNIKNLYKEKHA